MLSHICIQCVSPLRAFFVLVLDCQSCYIKPFVSYFNCFLESLLDLDLVRYLTNPYIMKLIFCCLPGFPILGVEWQKIENPDLRLSMGMKPDQKGVRIRRIDPTSPEYTVLKPSDIILSFDGVDIANDGTGMMQIKGSLVMLMNMLLQLLLLFFSHI